MAVQKKGRRKRQPPVDVNEEVRKRRFVGEVEAEVVVDYLNQRRRDLDDPIIELIEHVHQFEVGQLWEAEEIVRRINDAIRDLRIGIAESHSFEGSAFSFKQVPTGDIKDAAQTLAWTRAIDLHKLGLLGRIRRCAKVDCQKWFFAILPNQQFHTEECRLEVMTKDPKFKRRRARYMKKIRKEKKGEKS